MVSNRRTSPAAAAAASRRPPLPPIVRDPTMPALVDVRGGEPYEFDPKGYVPAALAATVICVRQGPARSLEQRTIRAADLALDPQGLGGALARMMASSGAGEFVFTSNLELLVAQSNVKNYYRTTDQANLAVMRYPGEW